MASLAAFSGTSVSGRRAAFTSSSRSSVRVQAATALPPTYKSIKPVGDRLLIKLDKSETKTSGGLLLTANDAQQSTAGTVVSAGDAATAKVGNRVIYAKFSGTDIEISGDSHVLLKEEELIGQLPVGDKIGKLQPLSDRILIQLAKAADKTAGGVLLASEQTEKPTFGKVVAVGPGRKDEDSGEVTKPKVAAGQSVMFSKYSGTEFDEDGESFIVVHETDILCTMA